MDSCTYSRDMLKPISSEASLFEQNPIEYKKNKNPVKRSVKSTKKLVKYKKAKSQKTT